MASVAVGSTRPRGSSCWAVTTTLCKQNRRAITLAVLFGVAEIVLLVPDWGGEQAPSALGLVLLIFVAFCVLMRYLWRRMCAPWLELAGNKATTAGSAAAVVSGDASAARANSGSNGLGAPSTSVPGAAGARGPGVRMLRCLFVLFVVALPAISISALVAEFTMPTKNGVDPHPYTVFSFDWAAAWMILYVAIWMVDMLLLLLKWCRWAAWRAKGSERGGRWDRALFPLWVQPVATLLAWMPMVTVASLHGRGVPETFTVEVPLLNLPSCLDGYKIAMVADVHAGVTVGRPEVERHVAATNALGCDAIVIVGDLVDDAIEDIETIVRPVGGFSAPDGVYFAQGNHEHYTGDADEWALYLEALNITVLEDTRVSLPPGATGRCSFDLAGVDDYEFEPDYASALAGRNESRALVLLAHQPKQVKEAADYGVGLQLAGHTHGGQVWPYHVLAWLNQGFVAGLYRHKDTYLYVSGGTVGWAPRMRLFSRTEYTVVVLRSTQVVSDGSGDTGPSPSAQATAAAGILLIATFIYCLGYPVLKAVQRARRSASGNTARNDEVENGIGHDSGWGAGGGP